MKQDIFLYAFNNLLKRFLRSSLTILSILIGIMAIFALVSFGDGLNKYMDDTFEKMGTNKLIVQGITFGPPGSGGSDFTPDEVESLEKISGVDIVAGLNFALADVKISGEKPISKYVMGLPTEPEKKDMVMDMLTVDVIEGRFLKKSDKAKVVLGYNYQFDDKIFDKGLSLGDSIEIAGASLDIVGFMDSIGNAEDDSNVYITSSYYEELFDENHYIYIYIQAKADADLDRLSDKVKDRLLDLRELEKEDADFYVQSFEDIQETSGNVLGVINAIVLLIALISIFVAAVNIANTMYTSVIERTQEIGIMKAIGAKNSTILQIFLIESGMLGLIGGGMGVLLGFLIASGGGAIAAANGYTMLQPYFRISIVLACLLGSSLMSGIAGFLPALQASKQKPVDSLRYE